MIDLPPPSYEQTIEAIAKCDISRGNIRVEYADYLQSNEVTISDLGMITHQKLRCLKNAVHPFYVLTIQDGAQRAAFYEFSKLEDRPKQRADARNWLQLKGLLDRLPAFDPKYGIEEFAEKLELACGLKQRSALMIHDISLLTVQPDFFSAKSFDESTHALECLTQMFAASDAPESGVRFGLIGNEAYAEESSKK